MIVKASCEASWAGVRLAGAPTDLMPALHGNERKAAPALLLRLLAAGAWCGWFVLRHSELCGRWASDVNGICKITCVVATKYGVPGHLFAHFGIVSSEVPVADGIERTLDLSCQL